MKHVRIIVTTTVDDDAGAEALGAFIDMHLRDENVDAQVSIAPAVQMNVRDLRDGVR